MDLAEWSKFLPVQFQRGKIKTYSQLLHLQMLHGWLGSVFTDRDFRSMAIQDPYSRRYQDVGVLNSEKWRNIMEYSLRSQVPFYKTTKDVIAGATGQLDYYGRKREWS